MKRKVQTLTVNITPNEVLFPNSQIIIQSREPLDPKTAQGGIVVLGVRGQVQLSRGRKTASWSPNEALKPGHHVLLVRGVQTKRLRGMADDLRIPFFIANSRAKIPENLRVENITRVRVGDLNCERLSAEELPKGKYIDVIKATNRKTGAPMELAFNESGGPVNAQRAFQDLQARRLKKFGKLHETLFTHLQSKKRGRLPVAIWLQFDNTFRANEKKTKGATPRPSGAALRRLKAITMNAKELARLFQQEHGARDVRADAFAPVVFAELTPAQIQSIAKRPDVAAIFLHEITGIDDLADSIAIANSDDVHLLGFKGNGVKVAIWENSPDDTTDLSTAGRYKSSGFDTSDHARLTHGIIKNVESNAPHGHAPLCSLHSANNTDLAALAWAAHKGCTVINQSFHRDSEPGSGMLSHDDVYKDWLVLQWPYPTICQAAGNFWAGDDDNIQPPSNEFVNHKGYNSLTVGNHDDTASAMSGDSVFRNPSTTHGDRELPEIAANGTMVTAVKVTSSGTSFASPAAAGCAALIQSADETLKSWPEGCRAILLAGAKRNIAGNTWWQDVMASVDAADGSGAVDALESVQIAKERRPHNAGATRRGWDVGTLRSADFSLADQLSNFSYRVKTGSTILSPLHVKVALAWHAKITFFDVPSFGKYMVSGLSVDLDLAVFDTSYNQVAGSASHDNSYEIAEFDARPGQTYIIRIRRWSGTDDVWYGIAWTVTGGLFWSDTTRFTALEQALP